MPKFEVLCATMHQKDFSKIKEMNVHSDIVFANQCDHTSYEEYKFSSYTAKMISTQTRGVGKNRNLALIYATAEICLLADDDVVYDDGYENKVCNFYDDHPDADVVIFNFKVSRNGSEPKDIIKETKKLKRKKLQYGTYAISFRRTSIDWNNIRFHHYFGGGALYSCGEDSKFLNDCFNNKLSVYLCSDTLGTVNHNESTWFEGVTDKFLIDKGVLFYSLMGGLAIPAAFYHCFKHRNGMYSNIGWKKAYKLVRQGVKQQRAGK